MSEGIRVLHVDDEPDFADLVAELLPGEDDRLEVVSATDAGTGLDLLEVEPVDCVVSDYQMPGMDGLSFLDAVRDREPLLPFILFTGKGSEEIASEAISVGVTDYLQKSTGMEQYALLANRVTNAVEQHCSRLEAERTRRFFTKLTEHSTDVIPVIDPGGTVTYLSPSVEPILGYDPDAVVGENAFDYIHPEDLDQAAEQFAKTVENPDIMPELEYRFKHADGSWIRLHGRARNLLDDPDVGGIVSYNRVIED